MSLMIPAAGGLLSVFDDAPISLQPPPVAVSPGPGLEALAGAGRTCANRRKTAASRAYYLLTGAFVGFWDPIG